MILSRTTPEDLDEILSIERNIENLKFIISNSKSQHLDLIRKPDSEHITLKSEKGKILGYVILIGIRNESKNIEFRRIVICEKEKGYGRKAIREIMKLCFDNFNCERIWLDVLEENYKARKLYKSEGFVEEREVEEEVEINEKLKKLILMSICRK